MPEFYHSPSPTQGGSPHVFIATPCMGAPTGAHMASIVRAMPLLMGAGVAVDHFLLMNNCHVDDSRNMCVARFLETKCDALIFIDADVSFPPDALYRLVRHEGDVIAGVYPRKDYSVRSYPFKIREGMPIMTGPDGVIRQDVVGLPTGFMKIRRGVLERMAELRVDRMFKAWGDDKGPHTPIIFERGYQKGERLSGDYEFCRWASELGYTLALDTTMTLAHSGEMKVTGNLALDLAAAQAAFQDGRQEGDSQERKHINGE